MNSHQSGGWGQGAFLPAMQSGVVSAKYHSFWGRRVRGRSRVSGSCQNQACLPLENQNLTHFSCASHDIPLCLGLFCKITRWPWIFLALQIVITKAWCHYLSGAVLYKPCPGIFLLTNFTLAAFMLPFSLPSPIHLSWWKKVCDKWFKTDSGTEEDFFLLISGFFINSLFSD